MLRMILIGNGFLSFYTEQPVPPVSNPIIGLDETGALKVLWRCGDLPLAVEAGFEPT